MRKIFVEDTLDLHQHLEKCLLSSSARSRGYRIRSFNSGKRISFQIKIHPIWFHSKKICSRKYGDQSSHQSNLFAQHNQRCHFRSDTAATLEYYAYEHIGRLHISGEWWTMENKRSRLGKHQSQSSIVKGRERGLSYAQRSVRQRVRYYSWKYTEWECGQERYILFGNINTSLSLSISVERYAFEVDQWKRHRKKA